MHLQAGQILADKYRIVRVIGTGGMGAVYEGENVRIRRRVAIKTLHQQVATKTDVIQRFEREAQAAGRIGSEHIVEVLDMGDLPDGSRFMVMEFLDGVTLGDRIVKQGRIPPRELVPIMEALLDGLAAAHAAGIIHRDLKPANIFLMKSQRGVADFVKILDFGVSKFNILNSEEMSMTRTGAVVGTPYYMSPEQAKGSRAADPRSDLYSSGVILYEAITGQVPFNAQTFNELIFKIALESPPPPEQFVPTLDPAFGGIMRRAMAREPNERYQTAAEMREALSAWARDYDAYGGQLPVGRGSAPYLNVGAAMRTQMLPMIGGAPAGPLPAAGVAAQHPQQKTQAMTAMAMPGMPVAAGHTAVLAAHGAPAPPYQHQHTEAMHPGAHPYPAAPQYAYAAEEKPPPLGAEAYAGAVPQPPKNRAPLVVGLSVAVLCLGGGGYFVYAKTATPAAAGSTAAPEETSAPERGAAASASPTATASPTAEATASSDPDSPTPTAAPSNSAVAETPPTAPRPNPPIPGTARPSPPPTAAPTATAATKPTPSGTASSGRKIGSDL